MSIIQLSETQRPAFAEIAARRFSELFNTKVEFREVLDELFLYEQGMKPSNKVLSQAMISLLKDVTINNPNSRRRK